MFYSLFLVRSTRAVLAMSLLLATEALAGDHLFIPPNGEFEAYTIAANEDDTE